MQRLPDNGSAAVTAIRRSHLLVTMWFIVLGSIVLPGAAVDLRTWFMKPTCPHPGQLGGPAANLALAMLMIMLIRLYYDPAHTAL